MDSPRKRASSVGSTSPGDQERSNNSPQRGQESDSKLQKSVSFSGQKGKKNPALAQAKDVIEINTIEDHILICAFKTNEVDPQ